MILDLNSIIFEILILMFVNIFYIHIFFLFLDNHFKKTILVKNRYKIYMYICFALVISVINMIKTEYFSIFLLSFLVILFICFKGKAPLKFIVKILNLFFCITVIFNFILRFLYEVHNVTRYIFVGELVLLLLVFLKIFINVLLKLMKPYLSFDRYSGNLKRSYLISFILMLLFISFVMSMICGMIYTENDFLLNAIVFIFILNIVIVFNFVVIIFYLNSNQKIVSNTELKIHYYDELMSQFKKHIDEVKKLRHDFKNHVLVMSSMLNDKHYEDLSRYIKRMFYEEQVVIKKLIITGNPIIDVIINNKLNKSIKLNIKVHTNIYVPSGLNIDEFDLVVVLGNIIDNAIEATCKLNESDRYIKIFIRYNERKTLIISVLNTYDGKNKFLKTKTTKDDKENHGIGLKNVQEVMNNNNGFFEINYDNKIFEVKVMFYDIEQIDNKKV